MTLTDWGSCLCNTEYESPSTVTNPRCPEHNHGRDLYLRRTYGITLAEYWEIFDYQSGRCGCCRREAGPLEVFDVDHDHKEHVVRGLLCRHCNHRVIGRHRDPNLLDLAAQYLYHPPAFEVLGSGRKTPVKKRKRRTKTKR